MRKILIISVLLISGCSLSKSESGKYETVSLGEGCAVNVQADSYQVACSSADPARVVKALKMINQKIREYQQ